MAATEHINLPSYEQMGRAATALERIAANMDAVSLLGNFATVEDTNTASQSYKTGDYLVLNKLLYRVTSPIASGGTITIGTNVIQTSMGYELSNLLIAFYDATDESIVFRSHEIASYDPTDESITINI
jgi:hypothetical protein